QARVLRARSLAEQRLLPELIDLRLELRVLVLHVDEPREVSVDVAERPRDALGRNLERPQDGRTRRLNPVQRPGRRLAEGDRDQDQREHYQTRHHSPPPKGRAVTGRERLRSRSRNGRAQDRADTAVASHETAYVSAGFRPPRGLNPVLGTPLRGNACGQSLRFGLRSGSGGGLTPSGLTPALVAPVVVLPGFGAAVDGLELLEAAARADGHAGQRA